MPCLVDISESLSFSEGKGGVDLGERGEGLEVEEAGETTVRM